MKNNWKAYFIADSHRYGHSGGYFKVSKDS